MFELIITRAELEDLIKKMSIPIGKDDFIFKIIAPTITPHHDVGTFGYLEWIGTNQKITVWVRAKGLEVYGISAPIRLPLSSRDVLEKLSKFDKKDMIKLTHDIDSGENIFTTYINGVDDGEGQNTPGLLSIDIAEVTTMQKEFPYQFKNDVIVYDDGRRPDFHATCDVSVFQEIIADTNYIKGKKKKGEISNIYQIVFDEKNGMLRSTSRDNTEFNCKTLVHEAFIENLRGNGTLHCSFCFPEVINVLSGEIDVYALEGGPMWIVQMNEGQIIHYVVLPANISLDELQNEVYEEQQEESKARSEERKAKKEAKEKTKKEAQEAIDKDNLIDWL